ncbi:uncharacterized protein L201_000086 [Kwoniella dendrophila CBS 6074]|uniref:F-box domain-containing protein n=1 Tax=Kwoniella dendrophila CBS 6074 TaxID=1295534 RepID=A0AAX4JK97_9TREE
MSSTATPKTASYSLAENDDIISHIFSFLEPKSLFATLLTNKRFFQISTPILYRNITVQSGLQNLFYRYHSNESNLPTEYTKIGLLRLIKRMDIYVHQKFECPFHQFSKLDPSLDRIPNLKILHIAGGERPLLCKEWKCNKEHSHNYCEPLKCPFIQDVCMWTIEKVIIRELDFRPLRRLIFLEQIILKLRPCQLPNNIDTGIDVPYKGGYEEQFLTTFNEYLIRSLLHAKFVNLKIVWWDENHSFRIDWKEFKTFNGMVCSRGASEIQTKRMMEETGISKGCDTCPTFQSRPDFRTGSLHCDDPGSHNFTNTLSALYPTTSTTANEPNSDICLQEKRAESSRTALMDFFRLLGRRISIRRIDVYNFEKTAQMAMVGTQEDSDGSQSLRCCDFEERLIKMFKKGRKENSTGIGKNPTYPVQ